MKTPKPEGITPRYDHNRKRLGEIGAAIARYIEAGEPVPREWVEEINDITEFVPRPIQVVESDTAAHWRKELRELQRIISPDDFTTAEAPATGRGEEHFKEIARYMRRIIDSSAAPQE